MSIKLQILKFEYYLSITIKYLYIVLAKMYLHINKSKLYYFVESETKKQIFKELRKNSYSRYFWYIH